VSPTAASAMIQPKKRNFDISRSNFSCEDLGELLDTFIELPGLHPHQECDIEPLEIRLNGSGSGCLSAFVTVVSKGEWFECETFKLFCGTRVEIVDEEVEEPCKMGTIQHREKEQEPSLL